MPPYWSFRPSPPAWMGEGILGMPSRAALGADASGGDPQALVGLKSSTSPEGCAREKELKSLLMRTTDLHPHNLLRKLSACRTFEWTSSAPTVKMSLPSAPVDSWATHPGAGPGQSLSCPHSRSRNQRSIGGHPRDVEVDCD